MAVSAQGSLTEGHAQGAVPMRAFSIQFLSLILIILTFTIGVFAAHRIDGDKRKAAQPAVVIQKPATLFPDQFAEQKTAAIGAMNLETLFDMGTSDLNSVMIDSISEVLLAHDIEAKFVVSSPTDAPNADAALAMSLGRSAVLFRALLERGVPASAINVLATDEKSLPIVSVDFSKTEEQK